MADPRAPNHSGKYRPSASAASCRRDRTTPPSAVTVRAAGFSARMRLSLSSDSMIAPSALVPPASPVLPPTGTTATPAAAAARSTAATSGVDPGRSTASGRAV
jgi:hypothetical protein